MAQAFTEVETGKGSDALDRRPRIAAALAAARRFAENAAPVIRQVRESGIISLRGIAAVLNARGVRTARGGRWAATQVGAVLRRAALETSRSKPPGADW